MPLAEAEISCWIAEWARRGPGQLALGFEDQAISYAALEHRVARLAGALAELGVAAGERVAYLGHNAPELLDLLFACARRGAILVPLSARMPAPELEVVLANTEPAALLAEDDLVPTANDARGALAELTIVAFGELPARLARAPRPRCDPDRDPQAPLAIINTSGTTGPTKGAVLTHAMLHANALNVAAAIGLDASDRVLCNGPLFNTGPLNILTTPALAAGASVTILREFDPAATLAAIERHRITLAISTPAMTKALIDHPRWMATDLSSLRCVITGSTIVRDDVLEPWFARGVPVLQDYGLTEAMPVVTLVPLDDAQRLRATAGRPVGDCRVRIAAPDGSPLPGGEAGEVLVQGPTVMPGYWRNPQATDEAFHDGDWLRTGDAGSLDSEGMLTISGRLEEVIIVGSCNVFPADVEAVLADCPQIAESAVVGRPDDELGEVPVAFVVRMHTGALSADDVKALFEGRLAAYKHPQDVIFLDTLPRSPIGKVQADELRRSLT